MRYLVIIIFFSTSLFGYEYKILMLASVIVAPVLLSRLIQISELPCKLQTEKLFAATNIVINHSNLK